MEPGRNLVELHVNANAITVKEQLELEVRLATSCELKSLRRDQICVLVDNCKVNPLEIIQIDPNDPGRLLLPRLEKILPNINRDEASKHTLVVQISDNDETYATGQVVIYALPTLEYELNCVGSNGFSRSATIKEGDFV